ncbi:hypothetical protein FQZ97_1031490 [compost metagenome]
MLARRVVVPLPEGGETGGHGCEGVGFRAQAGAEDLHGRAPGQAGASAAARAAFQYDDIFFPLYGPDIRHYRYMESGTAFRNADHRRHTSAAQIANVRVWITQGYGVRFFG